MDTSKNILRVFPRRTTATPMDALSFVGEPQLWMPAGVEEIHVSVTFSWDLREAERLAQSWDRYGIPVKLGGPATGMRGEEFEPGRYLAPGYVITSRGCPNRCWHCNVWKRDGIIRELPIKDGWKVQDDNLLACSESHIRAVAEMLKRQPNHAVFSGGFEARLLKPWHIDMLLDVKPKSVFFAYDSPDDYEPLVEAGKMLRAAGFVGRNGGVDWRLRSYVLCGYPKDTLDDAEKRMWNAVKAGFAPMAMLWRDKKGKQKTEWLSFQTLWASSKVMWSRINAMEAARTADD